MKNKVTYIILALLLLLTFPAHSQSSKKYERKNNAIQVLNKSLEEGESDSHLAIVYENLAKAYLLEENYQSAENNFRKAQAIYKKQKNIEKTASIERELAKILELQSRTDEAILNYLSAEKLSHDPVQQAINQADANRLMNQSNSTVQSEFISQKIDILSQNENPEEIAEAYTQMAQINIELQDPEKALSNYEEALKNTNIPEQEFKINQKIANVYASNKQTDEAIKHTTQLLDRAKEENNTHIIIEQLINISEIYFDNKQSQQGIESLKEAYDIAVESNLTIEAALITNKLGDYYKKNKQTSAAIETYTNFLDQMTTILQADSSLIDSRVLKMTEERIIQLEKERGLTSDLLKKSSAFNTVLIVIAGLFLILLISMIIAWLIIKKKNRKIALQSLRREMNPHFIFNSLNSVNQFIAENEERQANKYLSSYSKLMRNIMDNSNKDFVYLSVELEQLREYLELEQMRFNDKFSYSIEIDTDIDTDTVLVPNMLIQPQLENAIWHGLRYREHKGSLSLIINKTKEGLEIYIEDNGIGISESKRLKTERQKEHNSRGLNNLYERIALLNKLYHTHISLDIRDKVSPETGVIAKIIIPFIQQKPDKK